MLPDVLQMKRRHQLRSLTTPKQSTTSTHPNSRCNSSFNKSITIKMCTIKEWTFKLEAEFLTLTPWLPSVAHTVEKELLRQRTRTQTQQLVSSWPQPLTTKTVTLSTYRTCVLMRTWIRIKWSSIHDKWSIMAKVSSSRTLVKTPPDIKRAE